MNELLLLLAVLVAWFVLNMWVLPSLGVKTCLSGSCTVDPHSKSHEATHKQLRPVEKQLNSLDSDEVHKVEKP